MPDPPATTLGAFEKSALLLLLVALAVGGFARLDSLHDAVLALDEYYSLTGILGIVATGLPEFPAGGFYTRAPLFHYPAAAVVAVTGEPVFGMLLAASLLGLAGVVAAFFYAKPMVGIGLAAVLAASLSLSAWQIEVSRFGRMYTAFHLVALVFFLVLHQAVTRGGKNIFLLPLLLLALIGTHMLGVLFLPLLLVPLLLPNIRRNLGARGSAMYLGLSGIPFLAGIAQYRFDARALGTRPWYPEGWSPESGSGGVFDTVAFPFHVPETISAPVFLLGLAAAGGIGLAWIHLKRREPRLYLPAALAASMLFAGVTHQLAMLVILGGILFARYWPEITSRRNRGLLLTALMGLLISAAWVGFALFTTYVEGSDEWLAMVGAGSFAGGVRRVFLGMPDFYGSVAEPWPRALTLLGLCMVAAFIYEFIRLAPKRPVDIFADPVFLVAYFLIILSVFDRAGEARYFHFLQPLALLILLKALHHLIGVAASKFDYRRMIGPTAAGVFLILFGVSGDLNPRLLANPSTPEVTFRLGEFEKFRGLWYERWDSQSPAEFLLERSIGDEAMVVAADTPPFSYYYPEPHFVYVARDHRRFRAVSRERGTVDLWSGRALLSTSEELLSTTSWVSDVWLVTRVDHRPIVPNEVWGPCLKTSQQAFLSRDERVEVLHLVIDWDSDACTAWTGESRDLRTVGPPDLQTRGYSFRNMYTG